ncbi:hypothetical protein EHQ52_05455 [Leptospira koniambonensis]|uniref:Uncharacterized protein n=1 Tax=Leptospira koniambonensis TaxID=2484950 RepID=A0A4R9J5L0_9LEPT|nr:hypothetical protein EHQ52_05455 [Leptospira koniambonensis]
MDFLKLNAVSKIWALVFVTGLAFSNYYLYSTTNSKLESYKSEPPFLRFDFTDSYLVDRSSQAPYLADGNLDTEWKKLRPSSLKMDFDLELRLSHRLKSGIYVPTNWKGLKVIACSKNTPPLSLKVLEREAINVDKESRLPDDTEYSSIILDFSGSEIATVYLKKDAGSVPQKEYPNGIWIWAVQGTFENIGPNACIKDIQLFE